MNDGLHERSGLDGTDEHQCDQQRITVILLWTPKQRRHGGQRDEHVSSQRPDPAFKRPFLPHSPPSLDVDPGFWTGKNVNVKGFETMMTILLTIMMGLENSAMREREGVLSMQHQVRAK